MTAVPAAVQRRATAGGGPGRPLPYPAGRPGDPQPSHGPATPARAAEFDARGLSDAQVDALTHRLIGPLTRLLRLELRLDRERIGRLRDPRR